MASGLWEEVAYYTDIGAYLYPNIKYIRKDEFSTLDERIEHRARTETGDIDTAGRQMVGISDRKTDPPKNSRKRRKAVRKNFKQGNRPNSTRFGRRR
jgi:hypothetical protein